MLDTKGRLCYLVHMRNKKSWKGERFGRILVLSESIRRAGTKRYEVTVQCDCGRQFVTRLDHIQSGNTTSCGCWSPERLQAAGWESTHGKSDTPEYKSWQGMLDRCLRHTSTAYPEYGGKGVVVHPEWVGHDGFVSFLDHVGVSPKGHNTLDRIDNNLGYVPGNVRWASPKEQARNTSKTRFLQALGRTQSLTAWAEEIGIKTNTLAARLALGWTPEQIVSTPNLRRDPTPESIQGRDSRAHTPSASKEYKHWYQMVRRCRDGKRTLHEGWKSPGGFASFLEHVGHAPSAKHTLDRIDNDKGYHPGNVRWATNQEQMRNRNDNLMIKAWGRTQCLAAWIEEVDLSAAWIRSRLARGMAPEEALTSRKVDAKGLLSVRPA